MEDPGRPGKEGKRSRAGPAAAAAAAREKEAPGCGESGASSPRRDSNSRSGGSYAGGGGHGTAAARESGSSHSGWSFFGLLYSSSDKKSSAREPAGPCRAEKARQGSSEALCTCPEASRQARPPACEERQPGWAHEDKYHCDEYLKETDRAGSKGHPSTETPESWTGPRRLEPEWQVQHLQIKPQDRGQDGAESRTHSVAESAVCQMKPGYLEAELQALRTSSHPLALPFLQALEKPIQIAAQLLAENQRLQQELQELKSRQQAMGPAREAMGPANGDIGPANGDIGPANRATHMPILQAKEVFSVQVLVTGPTGGCEKQFLGDVAQLLADQRVSLQVENYSGDVEGLLLLFCPVVSRVGTDIDNALEGLGRVWKVLLIVLHHKPKDSSQFFFSTSRPVEHPALVTTVHACYTIQDGFYCSLLNKEAVETVAAAITRELRGDS